MRPINTLVDQAARVARAGRALGMTASETAEAAAALASTWTELQARLAAYRERQVLRRAARKAGDAQLVDVVDAVDCTGKEPT